jgi:hypothetical protein
MHRAATALQDPSLAMMKVVTTAHLPTVRRSAGATALERRVTTARSALIDLCQHGD